MIEARITYDELMNELDKYRKSPPTPIKLTPQQVEFLKRCREKKGKGVGEVTWEKMAELWERLGWGGIGSRTLMKYAKIAGIKNRTYRKRMNGG